MSHRIFDVQEIVDLIASHLESESSSPGTARETSNAAVPDIASLKNFRLVNLSFGAGGARALFNSVQLTFDSQSYFAIPKLSKLSYSPFARLVKSLKFIEYDFATFFDALSRLLGLFPAPNTVASILEFFEWQNPVVPLQWLCGVLARFQNARNISLYSDSPAHLLVLKFLDSVTPTQIRSLEFSNTSTPYESRGMTLQEFEDRYLTPGDFNLDEINQIRNIDGAISTLKFRHIDYSPDGCEPSALIFAERTRHTQMLKHLTLNGWMLADYSKSSQVLPEPPTAKHCRTLRTLSLNNIYISSVGLCQALSSNQLVKLELNAVFLSSGYWYDALAEIEQGRSNGLTALKLEFLSYWGTKSVPTICEGSSATRHREKMGPLWTGNHRDRVAWARFADHEALNGLSRWKTFRVEGHARCVGITRRQMRCQMIPRI